jgi:hypothetical protein
MYSVTRLVDHQMHCSWAHLLFVSCLGPLFPTLCRTAKTETDTLLTDNIETSYVVHIGIVMILLFVEWGTQLQLGPDQHTEP